MNEKVITFWFIFLGIMLAGVVLVQATFLALLIGVAYTGSGYDEFSDDYIDTGYEDVAIDPDDPLLRNRIVLLNHDINARTERYVNASLFYLNSIDPDLPIDLYISTNGGWYDNAFGIIGAIQLIDAPVNTWALGGCHSSGAMILAAGTGTRYALKDAVIMVHVNVTGSDEPFSLDRIDQARVEAFWEANAALPREWFPAKGDDSYYLTAGEALKFGLIDEIAAAKNAPSGLDAN